jgi:pyruvate formate lyase activating enzyme
VLLPETGGLCKARYNQRGGPAIPFYGFITALALDPIEKKPLYHFRPGTSILSVGFSGCNLRCPFCQNWHISQTAGGAGGSCRAPGELAAMAAQYAPAGEAPQLAYTYSEPLVHIEFLLDAMTEARRRGTANVLVSNGCVEREAAEEVLSLTDAANIDLKCFSRETYATILGGDLEAVLAFARRALEKGVHLELTTLVVPGLNDRREELDQCRDFIAELETAGVPVPWHLSAYHPAWKWTAPPTQEPLLAGAARRAREKLPFVYTGNLPRENNCTRCPACAGTLVSRRGRHIDTSGLVPAGDGRARCASCGAPAPVRM